jgi:hypothetical protein
LKKAEEVPSTKKSNRVGTVPVAQLALSGQVAAKSAEDAVKPCRFQRSVGEFAQQGGQPDAGKLCGASR